MPRSATPLSLASPFPADSKKPHIENELKLITLNGSDRPFNFFLADLKRDVIPGIGIVQQSKQQRLITRQLDTPNQDLRRRGISLRIRGTYLNGKYLNPDINIKTKRPGKDASMRRGEYEANIRDPSLIDLAPLEKKYGPEMADLPDLREALTIIREFCSRGQMIEHFLIDTHRQRRVISLDNEAVGFAEQQQFYGELLKDKVVYQFRTAAGQGICVEAPEGLYEMEVEPLHAACPFNLYSGAKDHLCFGLSAEDEDKALSFLKKTIVPYGPKADSTVIQTELSKSGRGFKAWEAQTVIMESLLRDRGALGEVFKRSAQSLRDNIVEQPGLRLATEKLNVPLQLAIAA